MTSNDLKRSQLTSIENGKKLKTKKKQFERWICS